MRFPTQHVPTCERCRVRDDSRWWLDPSHAPADVGQCPSCGEPYAVLPFRRPRPRWDASGGGALVASALAVWALWTSLRNKWWVVAAVFGVALLAFYGWVMFSTHRDNRRAVELIRTHAQDG